MTFRVRALVCAAALAVPSVAAAGRWSEFPDPDKGVPLGDYSPVQQWQHAKGFFGSSMAGAMLYADVMGDKLSQLGRAWVVKECFEYTQPRVDYAARWALCGPDAKALDIAKVEAELKAEGVGDDRDADRVLDEIKEVKERTTKIGAAIDAAANGDPGVQKVLKVSDDATAEWMAWVGKNGDLYARTRAMIDGVHSNKSTHKSFDGCWENTYPAFQKLVKATKFPWEVSNDYLPNYWYELLGTTDGFMTATAFAECAYSAHASGETLVASSFNRPLGVLRIGPRTLTAAKLLDPKFAPKFGDRSIQWNVLASNINTRDHAAFESVNDISQIRTPNQGAVSKVTVKDDAAMVAFAGDKVESCLQWVETKKVQSVSPNGDVNYEKTCKKRGMVANQEDTTEISSKFTAGLKPGVKVLIVNGMPVTAWQGKKFVAVFGVAGDIKQK